jgi:flagellar biosynthesis protein FlhB
LERAWREGDVAVSTALMQAVALVVAAALAPSVVRALATRFRELLHAALRPDGAPSASDALRAGIELTAPVLIAVAGVVALVGVVQTRGLFAPARLAPDLSRLSPGSLLRGLLSGQRAFAVLRALVTACVVGYLVVHRLTKSLPDLAHTTGQLDRVSIVASTLAGSVVRDTALVLLALAVMDLVVTRRGWLARLRMTKQDVQREHRESEGDPQLKAARERAHREMLNSATIASVRNATVVVINPTHLASALRYAEGEDEAPVLLLRGEGELAQRIVDAAHAYGIPVVQDVPVAHALAALEEGTEIPPELYEAVALILREIQEN